MESPCDASEQYWPETAVASCARAEHISLPGATRSGFILPSRVPPELFDAGELVGCSPPVPCVDAPTVSTFFAVPGGVVVAPCVEPRSPEAKTARYDGWSRMNESAAVSYTHLTLPTIELV